MINFNTIPLDFRRPGAFVEIDNSRAIRGLPGMPVRILVLGQKLAASPATVNTLIRITSPDEAARAFGVGSMLHRSFISLKMNNAVHESWAVALADAGGGVAATSTVTFTGPATKSGVVPLWIAGQRVRVPVNSGDTATVIAAAASAIINSMPTLPVTAAVVSGVITLTARHKGEVGNYIVIHNGYHADEVAPAGVGIAIVAMSGGVANPQIDSAIMAAASQWFTDWVCPYCDAYNLAALDAELTRRFGGMVMQDGQAYVAPSGIFSAMATLGATKNSPFITLFPGNGAAMPTPPWELASGLAGQVTFNAANDPARPLHFLPIMGALPCRPGDAYTPDQRNLGLYDGLSSAYADDNNQLIIERLITTSQTNTMGLEDVSYLNLETMKTMAFIRFSVRERIARKFLVPRFKLASNGNERIGVVTPNILRDELIALASDWQTAGLVEEIDQYVADLVVERDASDQDRANAIIPPDIINQFRIFAACVQFRL